MIPITNITLICVEDDDIGEDDDCIHDECSIIVTISEDYTLQHVLKHCFLTLFLILLCYVCFLVLGGF